MFSLSVVAIAVVGCSGPNYDDQISALTSEIALLKQQVRELSLTTVDTTPTTVPPTTTLPATTTTVDANTAILLATYAWGEQSDAVRDLQVLIGATVDGVYGPKTRAAHIVALVAAGLGIDRVPDQPASTPTTPTATEPATATSVVTTTVASTTTVADDETASDDIVNDSADDDGGAGDDVPDDSAVDDGNVYEGDGTDP